MIGESMVLVNSWTEVGTLVAILWGVRRNRTSIAKMGAIVLALARSNSDVDDQLAEDVLDADDETKQRVEA